jgi:glycerophosphoryl diester phosphodiesterase
MFECDVKLSSDDVAFLMHDKTLLRTTNAAAAFETGLSFTGGDHSWATLSQLDAGSWHSRAFAGEPLPSFEAVARYCLHNGFCLNIEIKPTPGTEVRTGEVVAHQAARLWRGASVLPLLTSFHPAALQGALRAQPELPRGLLLDEWGNGWLEAALQLDCVAVVCNQALWDPISVTNANSAGLRTLSYTVNDEWAAVRLLALGIDGIITDRVDQFSASS